MRPQRRVRRSEVRPTYARRSRGPSSPRPKLQLPVIEIAWIRLAAYALVAIALIVGIGKLTAIKNVQVAGTKSIDPAHIVRLSQSDLSRQWFGGSLLLVNTSALANSLEQAEPAVKQAQVQRHWFHTVTVKVTERQPSLNWKTGSTVYLLDADATVIGPTQGPYQKLPTVTDSSNLPVKVGDRVAPTTFIAFCRDLASQLPAAGYDIADMTVPTTTSEVNVRTTKGIVLKFDTTRPTGDEVADLQAVQSELTKAKKAPTQYIDLRIEHKAYYK